MLVALNHCAQSLAHGKSHESIDAMPGFPAFCALAGLLSVHLSWGIQVLVWTRFRINYVYVLLRACAFLGEVDASKCAKETLFCFKRFSASLLPLYTFFCAFGAR